MTIGQVIRSMRESRAISQRELARRAKLGDAYLSTVERGKYSRIDLHSLLRICSVLGITLNELLIRAGLLTPDSPNDPSTAVRMQELERLFRSLPASRQEEVLAIVRTLRAIEGDHAEAPPAEATPPTD